MRPRHRAEDVSSVSLSPSSVDVAEGCFVGRRSTPPEAPPGLRLTFLPVPRLASAETQQHCAVFLGHVVWGASLSRWPVPADMLDGQFQCVKTLGAPSFCHLSEA